MNHYCSYEIGMHIFSKSGFRDMPWKNGRGFTTELFLEESAAGRISFRLSSALLASSGPFSRFPGLQRVLIITEGAGLRLSNATGSVDVLPFVPHGFSGDLESTAALFGGGSGRDFNVIFDPAFQRVDVQIREWTPGLEGMLDERTPEGRGVDAQQAEIFLYLASGNAELSGMFLEQGSLVRFSQPHAQLRFRTESGCRVIRVARSSARISERCSAFP